MASKRWNGDLYVTGNTIIGTISQTASGDWEANGCMDDWNDTELGTHSTRSKAKLAVAQWVQQQEHTR